MQAIPNGELMLSNKCCIGQIFQWKVESDDDTYCYVEYFPLAID